jgi:hypothetical protein
LELESSYLAKHSGREDLIPEEPEKELKYIVVIPAYLETRLEDSLVSLFEADAPSSPVEILIIINWPENESPENLELNSRVIDSVSTWISEHSSPLMRFHLFIAADIPIKKSGVGFARKLGMDEAVRRFIRAGQENGIIISFDADSRCDINFFKSIEEHFDKNPGTEACSIYFEHPLTGNEFPERVYWAILQYELHMRYYLHAMRHTGFPNAYYTVGSSFAVRVSGYCRQGGMNTRKAGEDFYFLQKFADLGCLSELNSTRVIPSPRPSLRVPFGTGKSVHNLLNSNLTLTTYDPGVFFIMKQFFSEVPGFFDLLAAGNNPVETIREKCLYKYLSETDLTGTLSEIYTNSGSREAFIKRFFRYFNMFRILKFVKYAGYTYPEIPVGIAARTFMEKAGLNCQKEINEYEMLMEFRRLDRKINGLQ